MIERYGKVNVKIVENIQANTLTSEIIKCVEDSANIYIDECLSDNRG